MKSRGELTWVDCSKGVAMLWIFTNHVSEQLLGYPFIANPSAHWPPLADRIEQLRWLDGHSLTSIAMNLFRYVGWTGDQGVGLFLILSGFGLTWGLLSRQTGSKLRLGSFYWRRAERIYPLWWTAHLIFIGTWLVAGFGLALNDPSTYLSFLGIRLTPHLFYYFTPAWWYIGLLIQLYLVYPLLWSALRKWGPASMLVSTCGLAFLIRLLGLLRFHQYVDYWSLGAVFITRLPEFALGIFLAAWMHSDPEAVDSRLRSLPYLLLAAATYLLGTGLSLTLPGMTFAPFLLGLGGIVLMYGFLRFFPQPNTMTRALAWTGKHSYAIFLAHHPVVEILLPFKTLTSPSRILIRISVAILVTIVFAVFLETASELGVTIGRRWWQVVGPLRTVARICAAGALPIVLLLGVELCIERFAPREVLGWGEKPSLQPDPVFGWRLKPSRVTRLRWESYDYVVTSNSLGFPGPEYSVEKQPGTFRILTTGDAFTSAEGVNTADAWPRLLESALARKLPNRKIEVMNFGMTAFGPNEYAEVVKEFTPTYKPDLIIVEFFVNDYDDALRSRDAVRGVGFDLPLANSWYALSHLVQLRRAIEVWLKEPLVSMIRGAPEAYGYFLGNISPLEEGENERTALAQRLVTSRLTEIKAVADSIGARAMLLLVPASVQVCKPQDLRYFPRHVDLSDPSKFDLERPQRITRAIAEPLGFQVIDLRSILKQTPGGCPYQRRNMHWTVAGHRQVAESLAELLASQQQARQNAGGQ